MLTAPMTTTPDPSTTDPSTTRRPAPTTSEPASSGLGLPALATAAIGVATVLAGLFAGFFFTYQISVIRGLAIVEDGTYVESFQAINATIRNGWFAVVFFGAVPAALVALALNRRAGRAVTLLLAATALLGVATIAITFGGNVVLNEELALVELTTPEQATAARAAFESDWNRLNLIRTLTAVGMACTAAAAAVLPRSSRY